MDSELKWIAVMGMVFAILITAPILAMLYFNHKSNIACIKQGGSPIQNTCLFIVRATKQTGEMLDNLLDNGGKNAQG